ncbi:MAG: cyclopropane-fatty-acyl-phospholipid synthase family protein [Candidatus Binatia bacterium]
MEISLTPGEMVRRGLGDGLFARVVEFYRAVFVDLDEVAACLPMLAEGSELLDVGGGDGALLERILRRQPGLRASLVDLHASVGLSLTGDRRERVCLLPSTRVRECASRGIPPPDAVLVADVLHHVPPAQRASFLREIREFTGGRPPLLVVKEVAPVGWRARLGLLSDRYVTGDRHVVLLTAGEVKKLVAEVFPELVPRETALMERDSPNYCILFEPGSPPVGVTGRPSS